MGCSRQDAAADVEWRAYAGDRGSSKYAPLDQINKDNVAELRIAWRRPTVDVSSLRRRSRTSPFRAIFRATPVMIDGVLYSSNGIGLVEAFHPAPEGRSGSSSRSPTSRSRDWPATAPRRRLLGRRRREPDLRHPRRIPDCARSRTGQADRHMGRRRTGQPEDGSRAAGDHVFVGGGPQVCGDVVMSGGLMTRPAAECKEQPPGNVQAFDVRTGKPRWQFRVIPRPGRGRQRDLGKRFVGLHRRREPVVADQRRRRAGLRLSSRSRARPTTCSAGTGSATTCSATRSSA